MAFTLIFGIDKNIIPRYNDKNIKFFWKNLIDIALENCQNIGQPKKYYLIFKIIVSGLENYFPFIFFINSHLMIVLIRSN